MILVISEQASGKVRGILEWPTLDERNPFEGEVDGNSLSLTEHGKDAAGDGAPRWPRHTAKIDGEQMPGEWKLDPDPAPGAIGATPPTGGWYSLQKLADDAERPPLAQSVWSGQCEPKGDGAPRRGGAGYMGSGRSSVSEEDYMAFGGARPTEGRPMSRDALVLSGGDVILALGQESDGQVEGTIQRPQLGETIKVRGSVFSGGRTICLTVSPPEKEPPAAGQGLPGAPVLRCTLMLSKTDETGWEMKGEWREVHPSGFAVRLGGLSLQVVPGDAKPVELAGTVWTGVLQAKDEGAPGGGGASVVTPRRYGIFGPRPDVNTGMRMGDEIGGMAGTFSSDEGNRFGLHFGRVILSIEKQSEGQIEATTEWPDLGRRNRVRGLLFPDGKTLSLTEYENLSLPKGQEAKPLCRYTLKVQNDAMDGDRVPPAWNPDTSAAKPTLVKLNRVDAEQIPLAGTVWKGTCRQATGEQIPNGAPPEIGMILDIRQQSGGQIQGTVQWPSRVEINPFTGFLCADGVTVCFIEQYKPDKSRAGPGREGFLWRPGYDYGGVWQQPQRESPPADYYYTAQISNKSVMSGSSTGTSATFSLRLIPIDTPHLDFSNTLWQGQFDSPGDLTPTSPMPRTSAMSSYEPSDYEDDNGGLFRPSIPVEKRPQRVAPSVAAAAARRSMILGIRWMSDGKLGGIVQFPGVGQQELVEGRVFADGKTIACYQETNGCTYTLVVARDSGRLSGSWNLGPTAGGLCSLDRLPHDTKRMDLSGTTWVGTTEGRVILEIERDRTWHIDAGMRWKPNPERDPQGRLAKPADRTAAAKGFVAADGSALCFWAFGPSPWIAEISEDRLSGTIFGSEAPFSLIRRSTLPPRRAVIDPWDGVTIVRSAKELQQVFENLDDYAVLWIRFPRSKIDNLQLSRLKQSVKKKGIVLWTDTDFAGAFDLACLASPPENEMQGTARFAESSHPVLRDVAGGELSYGLSPGALAAQFPTSQQPRGVLPLIGKSTGDAITAAAAIMEYGRGMLVLLPGRLAEKDLYDVPVQGKAAAGSSEAEITASRFLANLRSHSLAVSRARVKPLGGP